MVSNMKLVKSIIIFTVAFAITYSIIAHAYGHKVKMSKSPPFDDTMLTYSEKQIPYKDNDVTFNMIGIEEFEYIREFCLHVSVDETNGIIYDNAHYDIENTVYDCALGYCKDKNAMLFHLNEDNKGSISDMTKEYNEGYYRLKESNPELGIAEQFLSSSIISTIEGCGFRNDDIEVYGMASYDNISVGWLASNKIEEINASMNPFLAHLEETYNGPNASNINSIRVAIAYYHQTNKIEEEEFICFAYYKKDDYTHIIQFTTNWTPIGNDIHDETRRIRNHLLTQEECVEKFVDILQVVL